MICASPGSALADSSASVKPATKAEESALDPYRLEPGGIPVIVASTDSGVSVGLIASLAKYDPQYAPYRWRASLLGTVSGKEAPDGGLEFPTQDFSLSLDFPGLLNDRLRLGLQVLVQRNLVAPYYGIGNASSFDARWERYDANKKSAEYLQAKRYYQYQALKVSASVNARVRMTGPFSWFVAGEVSGNGTSFYPESKLSEDAGGESGRVVKSMMLGLEDHVLLTGSAGLILDTRDHEASPTRGMFHDVAFRIGQGLGAPVTFGGATLTTRFYAPIAGERLVLASRLVMDVLGGSPPFYELSRTGGFLPLLGPGGAAGVRGVPLGRYAGQAKVIGNLELRSTFVSFTLWQQRLHLGAVAFVDAGRVRTDFESHPELDVGAPVLKYGVGGGLRLRWGEAFVLRFDMAKSPDGVGAAFAVNELF